MRIPSALALVSTMLVSLAGCHVSTHKNGNNDNVDIGTPFGSMSVKTNDNVAASGLGITPYPGAQIVKKDNDNGAADVNMSFGSFHLGVKAVSYQTGDSTDKVLAFYRSDLKKYGDILQCDGNKTIGQPVRTAQGLTCDFDSHKGGGHISWNMDDSDKIELRTGSRQHQHIVAVEAKAGGAKIGLVALDLPMNISTSSDSKDTD